MELLDNVEMHKFINLALQWRPLVEELGLAKLENCERFVKLVKDQDQHISKNDPAHRWGHLTDVLRNTSRCYAWEQEQGGVAGRAAEYFMATLFLDTFASAERERHHILGAEYYEETIHPSLPREWKYMIDDRRVVQMCRWHRSSVPAPKEKATFVHLFAAADKGPMKFQKVIDRSVKYQKHHFPECDAVSLAFEHCREKFGRKGYAFKEMRPEYLAVFGEELEEFWRRLEDPRAEDRYRSAFG